MERCKAPISRHPEAASQGEAIWGGAVCGIPSRAVTTTGHRLPAGPVILGVSGASGAIYAVRALEMLSDAGVETHLVMTKNAVLTLREETSVSLERVRSLSSRHYQIHDIGAVIASGSFTTAGMLILPCSVKTLSGVANSFSDNLLLRAADVTLKERRPLVLAFREAPLHLGHLRLLARVGEMGGVIFPPVPAFYTRPQSLEELVDQTVGRVLQQLGIEVAGLPRWQGWSPSTDATRA